MTDQIASRVKQVLSQVLDVPVTAIDPKVSTSTSAAWTSLIHLMLMSELENEFGIVFRNQEIRELTSYAAILETISKRLDSGI